MNVRRGMNRLFIVAWVVYAVWLAWYAYNGEVDTDLRMALTSHEICVTQEHGFDPQISRLEERSETHLREPPQRWQLG